MRFWQNVEITQRDNTPTTEGEVYRFPGRAVARLHDEIAELWTLHDQQEERIAAAKAKLQAATDDTERTVRDANKVQAELSKRITELSDNWRRVTANLRIDIPWPDRSFDDDQ